MGIWELRRPTSPAPKLPCPFFSWGGFPPGTLASSLESPAPTVACSGLVRCHDNPEPPSPTAQAPLKNLSRKLPCLKINHGIEILKMSRFGQWNWGTGAKFFCPGRMALAHHPSFQGPRDQLQPTPPLSAESQVLLLNLRLGPGREAGRAAPLQQVPRVTLHPTSCLPLTCNTSVGGVALPTSGWGWPETVSGPSCPLHPGCSRD